MIPKKISLLALVLFLCFTSTNCINTVFIDQQTSIHSQFPEAVESFRSYLSRIEKQKRYDMFITVDKSLDVEPDRTAFLAPTYTPQSIKTHFMKNEMKSEIIKLVELKTKRTIGVLLIDTEKEIMNFFVANT